VRGHISMSNYLSQLSRTGCGSASAVIVAAIIFIVNMERVRIVTRRASLFRYSVECLLRPAEENVQMSLPFIP